VTIDPEEPLARAAVEAIQAGDLEGLRRLLDEHPGLATARIGDDRPGGTTRSLLHVATDWPGHFPGGPATVAALVAAGAEVDARFGGGSHDETPLHWAASSDDVESWTPCWTPGPTSRPQGASSPAAPRWPTRGRSGSGGPPTACWSAGPGPPSTTRPPWACRTAWRVASPIRRRPTPRR
jgi:hypothetical protein